MSKSKVDVRILIDLICYYIFIIMLPQPIRRQSSLPKTDQKILGKGQATQLQPQLVNLVGASNQTTQYFSFRIQNQVSQTDSTLAWTYNIPTLNPNQKQLYLMTQSFTTILQDFVGDNYPQSISIGLRNFAGFVGWQGQPSNKIIVLNLVQIMTHSTNNLIQRDLIYKSQTAAMWSLGLLRKLDLQVYVDDNPTPVSFPIQNSIALSFKILHVAI